MAGLMRTRPDLAARSPHDLAATPQVERIFLSRGPPQPHNEIFSTLATTMSFSHTNSPETHYSSLAPPPLRSAMKHSRPSTPSPGSPVMRYASPHLAASPSPAPARSLSHTPVPSLHAHSWSPVAGSHSHSHSPSPAVVQQGYTPKVGFDTFENPQASMFSYTLHVQNEGYARTKQTRVFLCAASPDESGSQALDWVLENLVQDGDELVVFRGADSDDLGASSFTSPKDMGLITAYIDKEQDIYRDEARELMRQVQDKCSEHDANRKVSLRVSLAVVSLTFP